MTGWRVVETATAVEHHSPICPCPGCRRHRIERTNQGLQRVIPGAERSAVQAAAAREASGHGRIKARKPQQEPGGMFATTTPQPNLFGDKA